MAEEKQKKRGPLSATDKRRNAGHKHPRAVGSEESTGEGKAIAHLFHDRRAGIGEGKRLA